MELSIAIVDAFTEKAFGGNPAAVCLLEQEINAALMQSIASEMNLSETAFVLRTEQKGHFNLRWFTPTLEIDLCGHATLASSFWMLQKGWAVEGEKLHFHTLSGELIVKVGQEIIEMDFPLLETTVATHPYFQDQLFGKKIVRAAELKRNWIFELEDEEAVRSLIPDFGEISKHSEEGIIITSKGNDVDCVSRFFGPNVGVPEDPVTGFAHCALMDYWNKRTGKSNLKAHQASKRGGNLEVEKLGNRVLLKGKAIGILEGVIKI
ncbi:PhzF family phenazine biosynthesis protein [Algoriphagus hitonicola]|uniref:Phenazine biosynthesis protein PhzF family n=1 Tax=Algoriphagus hitonicola TaxID=435880 RepID=A0A1I2RNU3_9BACT|nr:PhzF family phenazine biosynthesis protein [Algoriphagus hitonicola]SFG41139.1 phenazine biosynthesis protein PhzF family [Algoriphagus hitonicola]